jgi:tRNA 2-thiouridine synthesizing protein A
MPDKIELNLRGLLCPLPVLRLQKALNTLTPGTTVEVTATDPGVLYDIPTFCRMYGHDVLCIEDKGTEFWITVKVCPKS